MMPISIARNKFNEAAVVEIVNGGTDFVAGVHFILYTLVNDHQDIIDKHVDGHSEQDDTEEFTDNKDKVLA